MAAKKRWDFTQYRPEGFTTLVGLMLVFWQMMLVTFTGVKADPAIMTPGVLLLAGGPLAAGLKLVRAPAKNDPPEDTE